MPYRDAIILIRRILSDIWQLVRPALGFAIVAGLLMAIILTIKVATAPGENAHTWAQRVAGRYGGLLEAADYLTFVGVPLILGFIVAWQARGMRPGWLAAGLAGIIGGFPSVIIMEALQTQRRLSIGVPSWLNVELALLEAFGAILGIGAIDAAFGLWGAAVAVAIRSHFVPPPLGSHDVTGTEM